MKTLAGGETASVSFLHDTVTAQLDKLHLSPADRLLANALVDTVTAELVKRVGAGALSDSQRLQVSQVMDWIIEAAGAA